MLSGNSWGCDVRVMVMAKLGDVCEILDSQRIPITASDRVAGPYPYYGANGIQDYVENYIFDDELVLLAEDGGNFGSKDKPIAYRVSGKCWVNNHAHVLKPKAGLDADYLCYSLMFYDVSGLVNGATRQKLTQADMRKMEIPMRSEEEQRSIVAQLSKISRIVSLRKQEFQALNDLIKARFVEMFGSIHENRFPKCKLREVAHIKHGFAFSGEFFSDEDNGVVLVTPGNFALGGGFQEIRNRYFTSDYPDEYVLHAGDLIVTMTDLSKKVDTLGYGAIVPETDKVYLHNQRIGLFDRLDQRLNPVFMRWFMQTNEYRLEIVRTSTGSTVHHTSPDRILDSVVFLPPIEIQNSFVAFAKQVDKSKIVVQKALDEAQVLFDSLMQQYFG